MTFYTVEVKKTIVVTVEANNLEEAIKNIADDFKDGEYDRSWVHAEPKFDLIEEKTMEVVKLLILSTLHVPLEWFEEPTGWFHIAKAADGVLVRVPDVAGEDIEGFLQPCFDLARKQGASRIWFDVDGPVENLPIHLGELP